MGFQGGGNLSSGQGTTDTCNGSLRLATSSYQIQRVIPLGLVWHITENFCLAGGVLANKVFAFFTKPTRTWNDAILLLSLTISFTSHINWQTYW